MCRLLESKYKTTDAWQPRFTIDVKTEKGFEGQSLFLNLGACKKLYTVA